MKSSDVKACFIASSGGHLEQLMMLKPLMNQYNSFIVTESVQFKTSTGIKTYYLKQINRKEWLFIPKFLFDSISSLKILIKEKPDVVIAFGALATVPLCVMAKLSGKKLIYIESFAKVYTGTMTGRFLYRFADLFFVQWESMLKIYPKAVYMGGIY